MHEPDISIALNVTRARLTVIGSIQLFFGEFLGTWSMQRCYRGDVKPVDNQSRRHMFRDVQFPVALLNVTGNINLGDGLPESRARAFPVPAIAQQSQATT